MSDKPTTDVPIPQFVPNPTTILERGNVKRASDFRSIYSNHTTFTTSAFDFVMTFGEISESAEGELSVEQKVRVIMSPLHAKIFAAIISNNVRNFEARFGRIQIPVPSETGEAVLQADEPATPEG